MKKALILFALMVSMFALSGCDSKKVEPNTSLAEAYNAVLDSKKEIQGFKKECISYDPNRDKLTIYACPDVNFAALVRVLDDAANSREVNCISLETYVDSASKKGYSVKYYIDLLIEEFSKGFTSPVGRLYVELPWDYSEGKAELYRDSLERLSFVRELGIINESKTYEELYNIADGNKIKASFDTLLLTLCDNMDYDVTALDVFVNLKNIRFEPEITNDHLPVVLGFDNLSEVPKPKIVTGAFSYDIHLAELTYKLKTLGYTVEGISADPQTALPEKQLEEYNKYTEEIDGLTALIKDDGDFPDRLDLFLKYTATGYDFGYEIISAGTRLLRDFYAMSDTSEFPKYVETMCSYDEALECSPHGFILGIISNEMFSLGKWDDFASSVPEALPDYGQWCKDSVVLKGSEGAEYETPTAIAVMDGYTNLLKDISGDREEQVISVIEAHGLLCGNYNIKYFSGDIEKDAAFADTLIQKGLITDAVASSMLLQSVGEELEKISDLDEYLNRNAGGKFDRLIYTWDSWDSWEGMFSEKGSEVLSTNDPRLDLSHFSSVFANENTRGRKALLAVISEDGDSLRFPKKAYQTIEDRSGEQYRAIPADNTPSDIDDADILITIELVYIPSCTYSDGTKGYTCTALVDAYDISTGYRLEHLAELYAYPAETLLVGAEKKDEYPKPDTQKLAELISGWLTE